MAPAKSPIRKIIVQARVDSIALAKLDKLAEQEHRSRSEMIDFAVRDYVDRKTPKGK